MARSFPPPTSRAKARLVLCFIRGRWCPFCVGQLEAMNLILPEIEQAGASLVAISPQTVKQSFFMRDQHKLRFPSALRRRQHGCPHSSVSIYRVPECQTERLPPRVREPAVCEWGRKLGVADPRDLHYRARWNRALRFGGRGLHGDGRNQTTSSPHLSESNCHPERDVASADESFADGAATRLRSPQHFRYTDTSCITSTASTPSPKRSRPADGPFEWVGMAKERHDIRLQRLIEDCRRAQRARALSAAHRT